jgi:hypothetical protein
MTATVTVFIVVAIILVWGFIGYVLNIVWLFGHGSLANVTINLVLRIIGIFVPPVGALAGWFA